MLPVLLAVALASPAPVAVGWENVAALVRERHAAEAPERVDLALAARRERVEAGLRLDPKVEATYGRDATDPARVTRSARVSQGSPFGTEVAATWSSAPDRETRGVALRQELLRGGPWHGLAQDRAATLRRDTAETAAHAAFEQALYDAMAALAEAQSARFGLAASERAVERAETQHRSVDELVRSGYRARADLLVSEASLVRARIGVDEARDRAARALRQLATALWLSPETPLTVAETLPSDAWLARLAAVPWPDEPPGVRLARLRGEAAAKAADLARRDDLPSLAVQLGASRTRDPVTGDEAPVTRNVEAQLSFPLVGAIRRDGAAIAGLEAERARSAAAQERRIADAAHESARAALALADERLRAATRLLELAGRTLEIEQQKYADGKSTIAEVRRVQEEVERAQLAEIEARRQLVLSRVAWARDAGRLGEVAP